MHSVNYRTSLKFSRSILGGMSFLNAQMNQTTTKEKRYSSDNGYYTGGRPSTETPPSNRSGLNAKENPPLSDSQSSDSEHARKSSVEDLSDALLNITSPSVSYH